MSPLNPQRPSTCTSPLNPQVWAGWKLTAREDKKDRFTLVKTGPKMDSSEPDEVDRFVLVSIFPLFSFDAGRTMVFDIDLLVQSGERCLRRSESRSKAAVCALIGCTSCIVKSVRPHRSFISGPTWTP